MFIAKLVCVCVFAEFVVAGDLDKQTGLFYWMGILQGFLKLKKKILVGFSCEPAFNKFLF